MNFGVISANVMGLFVVLMLLYVVKNDRRGVERKSNAFVVLLLSTFSSILIDTLCYLPVRWSDYYVLNFAAVLMDYIVPFLVCIFFQRFIYLYLEVGTEGARHYFNIGLTYSILGIIATIAAAASGKLFYISDGIYHIGEYYFIYLLTFVVMVTYIMAIVIGQASEIGRHDTVLFIVLLLMPVVSLLATLAYPALQYNIALLGIFDLFLYLVFFNQSWRGNTPVVNKVSVPERPAVPVSQRDELTGVLNWQAFSEMCSSVEGQELIGVVFADLNSLRYSNERFGRVSGDKLLKSFALFLQTSFKEDEIYRIGGDEFVVIVRGLPKVSFDHKFHAFRTRISAQEVPMASVGCAYGEGEKLGLLVNLAEKEMEENRAQYVRNYSINNVDR